MELALSRFLLMILWILSHGQPELSSDPVLLEHEAVRLVFELVHNS